MKCIKCSTENNFQERTTNIGKCKNCQHQFVFEPTAMSPTTRLTDFFFTQLLDEVSAKKTLFFTPHQLYYLLNCRLQSRTNRVSLGKDFIKYLVCGPLAMIALGFLGTKFLDLPLDLLLAIFLSAYALGVVVTIAQRSVSPRLNRRDRQTKATMLNIVAGVLFLVALPMSIVVQSLLGMTSAIGAGLMAILLGLERRRLHTADDFLINKSQFEEYLQQWIKINGEPVKILFQSPMKSLPMAKNSPPITNLSTTITAANYDRVVVCNRSVIAQLLIRNNFSVENSCAVLTIDGYPESTFAATLAQLHRNPQLQVYALHDGSPHGVQMIHRLRQEERWFPNTTIPIIDVGIMPRQVMHNLEMSTGQSAKVAHAARRLPAVVRNSLRPDELKWLERGCYLDLESFSAQKIMQILQWAIDESSQLNGSEGEGMLSPDDAAAEVDFYLLENFGWASDQRPN